MHKRIERPEVLIGSTYKIKSPLVEHAMYVTINDIVLNADTEHEQRRPVPQVQHQGVGDHGWVCDLFELWV